MKGAGAVPPASGIAPPAGKTCGVNAREMSKRAKAVRSAHARGALAAPPADPAPHVLVIRVDFTDTAMGKTLAESQTFFTRMRDYFIENSYGAFVPTFTVTNCSGGGCGAQGAYELPNTMAFYGTDVNGNVAPNDNQALFDDAITAAQANYTFTAFDHVMVYHAGFGQETTGVSAHIWSVYIQNDQTVGLKTFPGFTVVPEKEAGSFDALGVICHEYGHQLGLPDLYDVSFAGGLSTVGAWDLMDYPYTTGAASPGDNPPHLGAWSKLFLGFNSASSSSDTVSLAPASVSKTSFVRIPVAGSANEYFLLEYRLASSTATYDKGIAGNGLVIWHIDDDVAMNTSLLAQNIVNAPTLSGRGYRGVDVVEADGSGPNPSVDIGLGDAFGNGASFTAPQSNSFAGTPSGVTIASIGGIGTAQAAANVAFIQSSPGLSVARVANYPNPAGDPSRFPVRAGAPAGTVTTFVLQLSKPVTQTDLSLDIYTLNGQRVRSVSSADIALRIGSGEPTTDYKWVYEYDWDGKTSGGDDAGSGVYVYRFKIQDKIETGKVVLVR